MRSLIPAALALFACGQPPKVMPPPPPVEPPTPTPVTLTVQDGTRPTSSTVMSSVTVFGLTTVGGNVATVSDTVSVRNGTTFSPVLVGESGTEALGTVKLIARRANASVLVTSNGVFQEVGGRFLRAPISDSVPAATLESLDAVGDGTAEAWWMRTPTGLLRAAGGTVDELELTDPNGSGAVKAVVARSPTVALVVKGERLYLVDVAANSVSVLAKGLGAVTASARLGDGHLVFVTADGLLRVSPSNEVQLLSLGSPLVDLLVDGDGALLATQTQLLSLLVNEVHVVGDLTGATRFGTVRDSAGAIFTLDGAALKRLATTPEEQPVHFADVKPFFTAHCTSCHATGANYATVVDYTNYQVAKSKAAAALTRCKDADNPMPPATVGGLLRPSQYQVLERWIQGGLLP